MIRALPIYLLMAVAVALAPNVLAHTSEKLVPVQLVVARWASAYQSDDVQEMDALLSEQFGGSAAARQRYLARLTLIPIKRVVLRHANYEITGDTALVSSIVHMPYREFYIPFSLTLSLQLQDGVWKILSIAESDEVPEELVTTNHPLQQVLHEVKVSLRDEDTGSPIYARVSVTDAEGDYWPPQGHRKIIAQGWREDIGGDVIVAGRTFAYVNPDFVLPLPAGSYEMEVVRGPEYTPRSVRFDVGKKKVPQITVQLSRWIHMARRGWYSGDSHTHFLDPFAATLEARGEDLNVINVLGSSGGNLITGLHHFTGAPSVLSDPEHITYMSFETRHDYLGHAVLLNLKEMIFPFGWGVPFTGLHLAWDYPTMAHQADKAHAKGALVAWAHLPHPHAELPIDVALNKIDAVETMVFGNPLEPHPARIRLGDLTPKQLVPTELWYHLLSAGFDLPGLGATDKMWNSQVSGSVRTYVDVDGKFTYQSWIDGIEAGRTFFSTAPMLFLNVDGHRIGDTIKLRRGGRLKFEASVESRLPVELIEIVVNGEVVEVQRNPDGASSVDFSGNVSVDSSSWIAARAYSSEILPTQSHLTGVGSPVLAHTSPIYVEVDGLPRRSAKSAEYLLAICNQTIEWARNHARYQSESQRHEVLDLYEQACNSYVQQLGSGAQEAR